MNADLETQISRIEWSALKHAYGDAGDVPNALLALFDGNKHIRDEALRHLRHSLNHQGFPENATPVAIPFFLRILQTPGVRDRDKVLDFLSELSQGHRMTKLGHLEEMTRSGWQPEAVLVGLYQEVYDEVCQGIPVYLSLLDDAHEAVSHQALYLLAWLSPAAPALLPMVRKKRHTKLSEALQLGVSIALGLCLLFTGNQPETSDLEYWNQELRSPSLLRRFGAAVGACYSGETPTKDILSVLHDALASIKSIGVPWNHGHLGSYVGVVLSWLRRAKEIDVVHIYQQVLEEKAHQINPRAIKYRATLGMWPDLIAQELLSIAFEKRPTPKWPGGYTPTPKWPGGYTPLQRWILRFLVKHPHLSIFEGYCCLREQINRLNLPHPTKKKELLRLNTLEDIAILTGEEYPAITKVLHQTIRIVQGRKVKQLSFLRLWERARRASRQTRRNWLVEIRSALSSEELCTFLEELLAQPTKTHRLDAREVKTLSLFVALLVQKPGMLFAAKKTANALVTEGCLRYPMPSRMVFSTFAELLLRLAPEESAMGAKLLQGSSQFFEHQETDAIRGVLLLLPEKERGEAIDALQIRSFAEPDEAWSLYDLAPSEKRAKRLLKALRAHADFFVGPGAHRLVTLLSSMPSELLTTFVDELRRPRALKLGYSHLLAASFAQHKERESLLQGVMAHEDPRVNWIVKKRRSLTTKELLQLEIDAKNKAYTRAKGGVIGANGKPWDGTMPRYPRSKPA